MIFNLLFYYIFIGTLVALSFVIYRW